MTKRLFQLTSLVLLFAANVILAKDVVTLAVEDSWPPFAKPDGTGISRSIVEKAYQLSGYQTEFLVVPYARALKMAEQGRVDGAFNVTRQKTTESIYKFGQYPILKASASFYYPVGEQRSFANLAAHPNNQSIALVIGYEYGDLYEQQRSRFDEVRVSHQSQIVKLLMAEKVKFAIMFDKVAAYTVEEMNLSPTVIKKGAVNHVSDIYVAFNKTKPDIDEKIAALDRGLAILASQNSQ